MRDRKPPDSPAAQKVEVVLADPERSESELDALPQLAPEVRERLLDALADIVLDNILRRRAKEP